MRAMVVYESKFGNTREVALRIGEAMMAEGHFEVEVRAIADMPVLPEDLDVLVLGAPTHAHGVEATMRGFVEALPASRVEHLRVAVFDTRLHWPKLLSGSAADGMAKTLTRKGATMVDGPQSFIVEDREGPLRDGEADRAEQWGTHILTQLKSPA